MVEEEPRLPTEEELREAFHRVAVADVLANALTAAVSLGYYRLAPETRDLPQARLAIEALRALDPVLRDGGVDEQVVRDFEQARANLQLAYAKAVEDATSARSPGDEEPAEEQGEDAGTEGQPKGERGPGES